MGLDQSGSFSLSLPLCNSIPNLTSRRNLIKKILGLGQRKVPQTIHFLGGGHTDFGPILRQSWISPANPVLIKYFKSMLDPLKLTSFFLKSFGSYFCNLFLFALDYFHCSLTLYQDRSAARISSSSLSLSFGCHVEVWWTFCDFSCSDSKLSVLNEKNEKLPSWYLWRRPVINSTS